MQFAAGQRWLQDVAGVHAAFGIPSHDDFVDLVDEEDDVRILLELVDQLLHSLFKLAADPGALHQGHDVELNHVPVLKLGWYVTVRNLEGQALDHGGLANTGLTNQHGVILRPAVQDLDHASNFFIAADDRIDFAVLRLGGQVDTELTEHGITALARPVAAAAAIASTLGGRRLVLRLLPAGLAGSHRPEDVIETVEAERIIVCIRWLHVASCLLFQLLIAVLA